MTDATTKTLPSLACKVSTSASKALLIDKLRLAGYRVNAATDPENLRWCVMMTNSSNNAVFRMSGSFNPSSPSSVDFPEACRILDELIAGTTPAPTPAPKPPRYTDAMPVRTFADGTKFAGDLINGFTRQSEEAVLENLIKERSAANDKIKARRLTLRRHDAYLKAHGKGGAA